MPIYKQVHQNNPHLAPSIYQVSQDQSLNSRNHPLFKCTMYLFFTKPWGARKRQGAWHHRPPSCSALASRPRCGITNRFAPTFLDSWNPLLEMYETRWNLLKWCRISAINRGTQQHLKDCKLLSGRLLLLSQNSLHLGHRFGASVSLEARKGAAHWPSQESPQILTPACQSKLTGAQTSQYRRQVAESGNLGVQQVAVTRTIINTTSSAGHKTGRDSFPLLVYTSDIRDIGLTCKAVSCWSIFRLAKMRRLGWLFGRTNIMLSWFQVRQKIKDIGWTTDQSKA